MLSRSPRRGNRSRLIPTNKKSSLFNLNIKTILFILLSIWLIVVLYFIIQLSKNQSTHRPPQLVQSNLISKPKLHISEKMFQNLDPKYNPLNNPHAKEMFQIDHFIKNPHHINQNNDDNNDKNQIINKNEIINDKHASLYQSISLKLESQKDKPKEERIIYEPIQLPKLSYSQPKEIYDIVKQQFKNADWKPEIEKQNIKITPSPTYKKRKPQNNNAQNAYNIEWKKPKKDQRYECLYYCSDVSDRSCVLKHISYWKKPHDKYGDINSDDYLSNIRQFFLSSPIISDNYPLSSSGYITFKNDCGGFNNLRQAYEFIIIVSWLTQRTMVFPVTEGWYLIDWGSIQIAGPKDESGKSNYNLFYDINHLSQVISLMNLTDFLYKFQNDKILDLPKQYHIDYDKKDKITEEWKWGTRQDFKKWQNHRSLNLSFAVPYGINHNALQWPSIKDVANSKKSKFSKESEYWANYATLEQFISHRTKREYFDSNLGLNSKEYIHFPSCVDGEMRNYRYLGQIATSVTFADYELELKFKKIIRDHSHLIPKVFDIASYMIAYLGLFQYTSAHIRRNDFQFKNSWVKPTTSFDNMIPFLDKNEIIYIASDAEDDFFANITSEYNTIKNIYRWRDFVEKDGKLYNDFRSIYGAELDVDNIDRKLVALIEMVITAGGKRFFGTTSSTYSAYITRIRGYIDAPDKGIYFHNRKGKQEWSFRATEYMIEMPDMWEDIKDYC